MGNINNPDKPANGLVSINILDRDEFNDKFTGLHEALNKHKDLLNKTQELVKDSRDAAHTQHQISELTNKSLGTLHDNSVDLSSNIKMHAAVLQEHFNKIEEHKTNLSAHQQNLSQHGKVLTNTGLDLLNYSQKVIDHTNNIEKFGQKLDKHHVALSDHSNNLTNNMVGMSNLGADLAAHKEHLSKIPELVNSVKESNVNIRDHRNDLLLVNAELHHLIDTQRDINTQSAMQHVSQVNHTEELMKHIKDLGNQHNILMQKHDDLLKAHSELHEKHTGLLKTHIENLNAHDKQLRELLDKHEKSLQDAKSKNSNEAIDVLKNIEAILKDRG